MDNWSSSDRFYAIYASSVWACRIREESTKQKWYVNPVAAGSKYGLWCLLIKICFKTVYVEDVNLRSPQIDSTFENDAAMMAESWQVNFRILSLHAWTLKVGLQMFQQSHSNGQETWHIRIILRLKRMPRNQSIRPNRFKKFQEVGVSNKLKDGRFFGGSSKDDRSGSMSGARIVLKSCDNVFAFHQTWNRHKTTGTHAPRYQENIQSRYQVKWIKLQAWRMAKAQEEEWCLHVASERVICATKQTISKRKG